MDYVEVFVGKPWIEHDHMVARLTGQISGTRTVYSYNNFIIVRLIADLTNNWENGLNGFPGFTASWYQGKLLINSN